jgi:hypothetical protein
MAFADIALRDNGSNVFDIALSDGGAPPAGNSNFFLFFDEFVFLFFIAVDALLLL